MDVVYTFCADKTSGKLTYILHLRVLLCKYIYIKEKNKQYYHFGNYRYQKGIGEHNKI